MSELLPLCAGWYPVGHRHRPAVAGRQNQGPHRSCSMWHWVCFPCGLNSVQLARKRTHSGPSFEICTLHTTQDGAQWGTAGELGLLASRSRDHIDTAGHEAGTALAMESAQCEQPKTSPLQAVPSILTQSNLTYHILLNILLHSNFILICMKKKCQFFLIYYLVLITGLILVLQFIF